MTGTEVRPSPAELADLVVRLVESEWPTSEEERQAWFRTHGLQIRDQEEDPRDGASRSFVGGGPPEWGWSRCGWGTFEEEFVGVVFFLWRGTSMDESERLAREVRSLLVARFGEPDESDSVELPDGRFTAFWRTGGRTVDLYLHGGMRPVGVEDQFYDEPVLQLHVDHEERSAQREEAARARVDGAQMARRG